MECVVIVREPGTSEWRDAGTHNLAVLPRIGERIEFQQEDGQTFLYRVVSVHHRPQPTEPAIDLLAVREGNTSEVMRRIWASTSIR